MYGHHDFGYGSESTSHIKSVWRDLKCLLNKFYNAVKPEHFIYFLKEIEWPKKLNNFSNAQKINNLTMIISTIEYNLLDKEILENYDKDDYNIDLNVDNEKEEDDEESSENDGDTMDIEL